MARRAWILPTCFCLLFALAISPGGAAAQATSGPEIDLGPDLTERERATHVLNRMAFGPRPGQVERVMKMGVENWMREQLERESIDTEYIDTHLAEHAPSLGMTMGDAWRAYTVRYTPYKNNKKPTKAELEKRREEQRERNRLRRDIQRELRDSVYHRAVYSDRQFEEVIASFWRDHFSIDQNANDVALYAPHWEKNVLREHAFGKFEHLLMATARHPAMLFFLDNAVSQKPLTEREVAMLERYEDRKNVPRSVRALQRQRGLNENYARELMELHTLGVDREYTQRDVTELARVFTGWTARWTPGAMYAEDRRGSEPLAEYDFFFNREVHDNYNKRVLGSALRGGGEEQGVMVIRALAKHKYTADFISRKLCRYLLRDKPDEELVEEVARVFRKTNGDLKQVYEAILFSDDFLYRQNHRVKFKTPFEYVISSIRATGAYAESFGQVDKALELMGQRTYGCPDPTGWYDTSEAWLDPGVLVYRWTFALDLAGNRVKGVRVPEGLLANLPAAELKKKLGDAVLPAGLTERTSRIIDEELGNNPSAKAMLAILLGSPDFQQQ